MIPVCWILAVVGGLLAFACAAGSAAGMMRRMDIYVALAVTPLPVLAMYFSAPELLAAIRAGGTLQELLYPGGPFLIGAITLLGTFSSLRQQSGGRRTWN
jgi:hypothetical protein